MKTVLVVDDELGKPANAEVFRREYAVEGVRYLFAGTGEEMFCMLAEQDEISSIFLDIRFEGVGNDHGLNLLKQLIDEGVSRPIIMMSSLSDAQTIIRAWELGAQGYVVKWSSNNRFYEDLRDKILKYSHDGPPASEEQVERRRNRIKAGATTLLKEIANASLDDIIAQANEFKSAIGGQWVTKRPFPADFQNYVRGWNDTDEVIREAEENHRLLYLNMDFGDGCTLRCPHCFTQEGAIDARGRNLLPYEKLKEVILEGKELGLRCVRILGRGEPTQWVANGRHTTGAFAKEGEDLLDFVEFLHRNDIIPLIFTRGQIIGDDEKIAWAYNGAHGISSGEDLIRHLERHGVSLFVGVSSIFPLINNEMVGIPKTDRYDYDRACRQALAHAITAGLNLGNPTRLAVEMPITNLNIREMAVRYILFQCLGISPCTNVYMVTGRAMTYGLGEITDPSQDQFLDYYSMVTYFARGMGIKGDIGSYAGIKECHDVSCGLYLTLNGDIYPCPGYEGIHSLVGSLRTHSLRDIWANNPFGGHPQSICPPKIGTHFPPDFKRTVEQMLAADISRYQDFFERIAQGLGV